MNTIESKNFIKEAKFIFSEFLLGKNLRITNQRNIILDTFMKTEKHLTSEELYNLVKRKDKSIGQATVYRMLKLLSEADIAREVDFGDGSVRYEHKLSHAHHDHLICQQCKKNIEVVDDKIEKLQDNLAQKYGFILTGHEMYLFGICKECRKKNNKSNK